MNKLALLLCYVQVVVMFIGFIFGRIAIYTGDKRDFNRFACVVLCGLIPLIVLEFIPVYLIDPTEKAPEDIKKLSKSPTAVITNIIIKSLIYGFQLALSICAFVHASRLTYPPANPEATKIQQNLEASYPQQNPEAPNPQQNPEAPNPQQNV